MSETMTRVESREWRARKARAWSEHTRRLPDSCRESRAWDAVEDAGEGPIRGAFQAAAEVWDAAGRAWDAAGWEAAAEAGTQAWDAAVEARDAAVQAWALVGGAPAEEGGEA